MKYTQTSNNLSCSFSLYISSTERPKAWEATLQRGSLSVTIEKLGEAIDAKWFGVHFVPSLIPLSLFIAVQSQPQEKKSSCTTDSFQQHLPFQWSNGAITFTFLLQSWTPLNLQSPKKLKSLKDSTVIVTFFGAGKIIIHGFILNGDGSLMYRRQRSPAGGPALLRGSLLSPRGC